MGSGSLGLTFPVQGGLGAGGETLAVGTSPKWFTGIMVMAWFRGVSQTTSVSAVRNAQPNRASIGG